MRIRIVHAASIDIAFLLCLVSVPEQAHAQRSQEKNIELFVGGQKVISAENVAKYSVGTEGIVDVRLPEDGNEFLVVAIAPGTTTLL